MSREVIILDNKITKMPCPVCGTIVSSTINFTRDVAHLNYSVYRVTTYRFRCKYHIHAINFSTIYPEVNAGGKFSYDVKSEAMSLVVDDNMSYDNAVDYLHEVHGVLMSKNLIAVWIRAQDFYKTKVNMLDKFGRLVQINEWTDTYNFSLGKGVK